MSLHLAIKILCAPHLYKKLNSFAHDLLKYFVQMGSELYDHFTVFNVHNLLHLSQNAYFFGPLDTFSAFKFESYLQILKKLPIKNNQPLEQVIKRVTERQNIYKDYDYNTHGIFFFQTSMKQSKLIRGLNLIILHYMSIVLPMEYAFLKKINLYF